MYTFETSARNNSLSNMNHKMADTFSRGEQCDRRKKAAPIAIWERRSADWFKNLDFPMCPEMATAPAVVRP